MYTEFYVIRNSAYTRVNETNEKKKSLTERERIGDEKGGAGEARPLE